MTQTTQQSGLQVIPIQVLLQVPHLTTSVNSTVCLTNFIELQATVFTNLGLPTRKFLPKVKLFHLTFQPSFFSH